MVRRIRTRRRWRRHQATRELLERCPGPFEALCLAIAAELERHRRQADSIPGEYVIRETNTDTNTNKAGGKALAL